MAVLIGVEGFALALDALNAPLESSYRPLSWMLFDLFGALWAAILFSGTKVIDGSRYFYRHNWPRRIIVALVPLIHFVAAGLTLTDLDDFNWASTLLLVVLGIACVNVLTPRWKEGVEPRLKPEKQPVRQQSVNNVRVIILLILLAVSGLFSYALFFASD